MFLTLSIGLALVAYLPVSAQSTYRTKKTYAYIGATPNPVGVGQEVLLHVGITDYLLNTEDGFEDMTVTVTKPNDEIEILGPFRSDSTGGTGGNYIPDMAGTYYLQTNFPAQNYTWLTPAVFDPQLYGTILYEASTSEILELVVQEEPLEYYPSNPLPTEYWTRPIDAQLWEWNTIAGNWVTTPDNHFAPYNDDAPETAHILWRNQLQIGGLAGGELENHAYECGDAYEGFFSSSVVISGVLFYNQYKTGFPSQEVVAVDLHTGEELWRKPLVDPDGGNNRLAFGQVFYWDSQNYHAAFPYLWATAGNVWHAFNPTDGVWVYSMENVPSGTNIYGPKGEIYRYTIDLAHGWMTLWNSSRVVSSSGSWISGFFGSGFAVGKWNATQGIEWNKTIPTGLPGSTRTMWFEDRVIGATTVSTGGMGDDPIQLWCISLKPGQEGTLLWQTEWQKPAGDLAISYGTASAEDKIFVLWSKETRQYWGFSTETGQKIWGPTKPQQYLDIFGTSSNIAYGKLYAGFMSGIIYCYNVTTGALLWTYEVADPYNENLWSNNWNSYLLFITDEKVYYGVEEHSPVDPKPRGAPFTCLNATSGKEIWRADGLLRQTSWGGRAVIGDSIIATMDTYDQQIYAVGKGPSATTVEAPMTAVTQGSSIVIRGTVTDVSPGTEDYALRARFPNGVPAVADESMSDWMLYVYKQFQQPANATGVEVSLDVVDENGNYRNIGTATSDANGVFSYAWKPDIPGKYVVYASFAGSNAYYGSYAETSFVVDEAPEPTAPPQYPQPVDNTMTIVGMGIAIIIAIAIAVVVIIRKK